MRESKWFKEGWLAFVTLEDKVGAACPYGAKSAKALIWEEGFRAAAREEPQKVDSPTPVA